MVETGCTLTFASKLRTCSIGPELALDLAFDEIQGSVVVERGGAPLWRKEIATGEKHTAFTLAEVERHHFGFDAHRIPGDAHVHFLGGSVSSYGDGIRLEPGDEVVIQWDGFSRPLRNPILGESVVIERVQNSS
jgi:hypothetical protein